MIKKFWLHGCAVAAPMLALPAHASLFHGETLDMVANIVSWAVLVVAPVTVIVIFWLVHILPEKIAEKKNHPQAKAIQVLCLLSLAFGGLLWPLAWLWAYSKPVGHKMAYGTDKNEHYFDEMAVKARRGGLLREELAHLREELDAMAARGALPRALWSLRAELDDLHARAAAAEPAAAPASTGEKR